jgi:uncharacterized spore protein YtfJ
MKKVAAFLIIFLLAGCLTVDAHHHGRRPPRPRPSQGGGGGVGAPLDGIALAVISAAGIAFYATRKKKEAPDA